LKSRGFDFNPAAAQASEHSRAGCPGRVRLRVLDLGVFELGQRARQPPARGR